MSDQIAGIIISGIFGLIIGSFLNVIIFRFDDLRSVINTRSHCPHCKKEIAWYDLIPFLSYLILRGKCRNCKKYISIQYPIVEAITAVAFGLLFWKFGLTLEFASLLIISSILIVVFTYDMLHYLIADVLVWIATAIWVLYLGIDFFFIHNSSSIILNSLYGGLIIGGFLGFLVLVSREKWMGAGDIKLGFLLGAMVAYPNALFMGFSAFTLGSIVGLILVFTNTKRMKDSVPFAPFLITAMFLTLFVGDMVMKWYLGILGLV